MQYSLIFLTRNDFILCFVIIIVRSGQIRRAHSEQAVVAEKSLGFIS